jgi:hypothetical protein
MKLLEPLDHREHHDHREEPHLVVAEARKIRRGWRFPVALALTVAVVLAITYLVRIYR